MDRETTSPFALQLFYRTGAFHRPDEFTSDELPPSLILHTWPDCTLAELAVQIAITDDQLLPNPAIGTRLAFRLMFQDTRSSTMTAAAGKYTIKELGSVVIGDGGPGLDPKDVDSETQLADTDPHKTLSDARFIVGDYISCAILPPLPDGSVAPASSARMGRGAGAGESRAAVGMPPNLNSFRRKDDGPFVVHHSGKSIGRQRFDGPYGGRGGGGGGGGGRFGMPQGEWRRGEKLPDVSHSPPGRLRNRGGF
ncbi:hypothetical protein F5Y16DRAFT_376334 [Xylariaceae sp. FL0255]|nr:hypothetical protein F5Y16DRAFT_376334 [Xylariaceae sp. FL0255]